MDMLRFMLLEAWGADAATKLDSASLRIEHLVRPTGALRASPGEVAEAIVKYAPQSVGRHVGAAVEGASRALQRVGLRSRRRSSTSQKRLTRIKHNYAKNLTLGGAAAPRT